MILDTKATLRSIILGVIAGGVLGAVELMTFRKPLPDELLTMILTVILILMLTPFLQSTLSGLVSGILAFLMQTVMEFLYLTFSYGMAIATYMLPYSTLFLYLIAAYPLGGTLAGYLGRKMQERE